MRNWKRTGRKKIVLNIQINSSINISIHAFFSTFQIAKNFNYINTNVEKKHEKKKKSIYTSFIFYQKITEIEWYSNILAINMKYTTREDREKRTVSEDFGSSGAICLQEDDILLSGGQVVSRRRNRPRRINPLPVPA